MRVVVSLLVVIPLLLQAAQPAPAARRPAVEPRIAPIASTGLGAQLAVPRDRPWEQRLRGVSFRFLKDVRRMIVRTTRYMQRTLRNWASWMLLSVGLLIFGSVASAADVRLLRVWRRQGLSMALQYAANGAVVFFRLLWDRRVSRWLRLPLLLALAYGIYPGDFLADRRGFGGLDDLLLMGLAARWYVRRCPDKIVQENAARRTERLAHRHSTPRAA